jgi:hypothetical protein
VRTCASPAVETANSIVPDYMNFVRFGFGNPVHQYLSPIFTRGKNETCGATGCATDIFE